MNIRDGDSQKVKKLIRAERSLQSAGAYLKDANESQARKIIAVTREILTAKINELRA